VAPPRIDNGKLSGVVDVAVVVVVVVVVVDVVIPEKRGHRRRWRRGRVTAAAAADAAIRTPLVSNASASGRHIWLLVSSTAHGCSDAGSFESRYDGDRWDRKVNDVNSKRSSSFFFALVVKLVFAG
jgi:hypothetical protein